MTRLNGSVRAASLIALGFAVIAVPGVVGSALADPHFIGGADGTDNDWRIDNNWSTLAPPGPADDVTVDPSHFGAAILNGDSVTVNSLMLNGGINVNRGGSLTVTNGIIADGVSGYKINNGTIIANTITTTYAANDPDNSEDDQFAYIGNTFHITGALTNAGAIVNGGVNDDGSINSDATWDGTVDNSATGTIFNSAGSWTGDVLHNYGLLLNDVGATWTGAVVSNENDLENIGGSTWIGDVKANTVDGLVRNIEGGIWRGDVVTNEGSIDNDGGIWWGKVLSNDGTIFNTAISVWNGDIANSSVGNLYLSGTVNGAVDNAGGNLFVLDPLSGVTSLTNTGILNMDDNDADDSIHAQSWSGTGTAIFDLATAQGRSDHVVLSGNYDANTNIDLLTVGPAGRVLGDIPLVTVDGIITGDVTVSDLPGDGVISYRLVQNAHGWVLATSLNDAPAHAASAMSLIGRTVAAATLLPAGRDDACGSWVRALGGGQNSGLADSDASLGMGGMQFGYDTSCLTIPGSDARLRFGVTAGAVGGSVSQGFAGDDRLTGSFGQGFAGLYGDLVAGSLRAVLQGQIGMGAIGLSDPQSLVDAATLSTARLDLSGSASYELAFGNVSLTPEIGFAASDTAGHSTDFADVGTMSLNSGPVLDAHAGATLAVHLVLPDGATTFTPLVGLSLHDELASNAVFTDALGGTAGLSLSGLGSYAALTVGANLFRSPAASGETLGAGLRADFKFGSDVTEVNYGGYAQVKY